MRKQLRNKAIVIILLIACCIPFLFLWMWYSIVGSL